LKAKELIKILQKDVEREVLMKSDNFELSGSTVPITYCTLQTFKKRKKNFRDGFDGGRYTETVYEYTDEDGELYFKIG
jgi:hypothetical protein